MCARRLVDTPSSISGVVAMGPTYRSAERFKIVNLWSGAAQVIHFSDAGSSPRRLRVLPTAEAAAATAVISCNTPNSQ